MQGEMEPIRELESLSDLEPLIDHGRPRMSIDDFKEQVRVNLLRYLDANGAIGRDTAWVAHKAGCSVVTIQHFANGSRVSLRRACILVQRIPELGGQIICPTCGGIPGFSWI